MHDLVLFLCLSVNRHFGSSTVIERDNNAGHFIKRWHSLYCLHFTIGSSWTFRTTCIFYHYLSFKQFESCDRYMAFPFYQFSTALRPESIKSDFYIPQIYIYIPTLQLVSLYTVDKNCHLWLRSIPCVDLTLLQTTLIVLKLCFICRNLLMNHTVPVHGLI